jgi:hypothetical protein
MEIEPRFLHGPETEQLKRIGKGIVVVALVVVVEVVVVVVVVEVVGCALVCVRPIVDEVVAGVVTAVVLAVEVAASVVTGTGQVVDAQMQSNQSPLLNFEYTRTLVPFDK